jgi:hypothetical protein
VKTKYLIALSLVLVGTNLFTFATSRYWTTKHVLTRAREHVITVMEQQRSGETRTGLSPELQIQRAIGMAGGMYYWWNDGLIYWGAAVLLTLSGLAVTRYELRKKVAGSLEK